MLLGNFPGGLVVKTAFQYRGAGLIPGWVAKTPHALRPKIQSIESMDSAQDPDLIPGLGRSPREGIAFPLQDSWASLVAQMVKNPPAMGETWV